MAEYLASIFGTEKDKVNCSFYFKIGACRHGDRCSRLHNKPTFNQVPSPNFRRFSRELGHGPIMVLLNLYRNPQNTAQNADGSHCHVSDVEEVFMELQEKYGEIEEMNVCDNLRSPRGQCLFQGHPQGPIPATVPKKENDDVPHTTGMVASEVLAILPSTLDRHRCSWPGLLFRAPLIFQGHLPQPLDPTAPPLIKFLY
ncbi:uncharacterized protein LOC107497628 isoform X2 [Rousettus aegyptiacus]|uniref:uncharacterized protein LOC107497628 isoform X2 n=1 Tax=Rousettus aegyptiacus TaxID=9407 RepID=UPI00168D36FF|nr:uncharacterized protein LOC107497628 isoform X2 [Rousettus aegyptiacus]